ncbi:sulfurtransferase complex subunit TusD [Colwellia echini]|uniref:Sulfurtransferase complex subunit TusD n=1 Tax=Colwellia echini TaxID=1982103 RepID=A0ABY3N0S8_9GAMM|nr:sulfurtransferase complex subunit TusD [Colwellia echini]TYK66852.1 sulfurtransferase complex subunit TusD [Colwellia echini]
MNTLAVVITTPPHSPLTATAINYVESALVAGINVIGVFFYQGGAMHANSNISIASDEYQAIEHWQQLAQQYQLPLHICITAAEKRGIACDAIDGEKLNGAFTVSGLGELVELSTKASRLVQF